MCALLVSSKIQELITVACDAFPLLLKECLKLRHVLQDDGHRNFSGSHHCKDLVEIVRERHVCELVHAEMHMDRQSSSVPVIGHIEQLLEKLRVQD